MDCSPGLARAPRPGRPDRKLRMNAPAIRAAKDPVRKRNLALLILFFGIAAVAVAAVMPGRGSLVQTGLAIAGLTATPFALVGALVFQVSGRRLARMRRGEGVIARWTVNPAQWRAFVEQS